MVHDTNKREVRNSTDLTAARAADSSCSSSHSVVALGSASSMYPKSDAT